MDNNYHKGKQTPRQECPPGERPLFCLFLKVHLCCGIPGGVLRGKFPRVQGGGQQNHPLLPLATPPPLPLCSWSCHPLHVFSKQRRRVASGGCLKAGEARRSLPSPQKSLSRPKINIFSHGLKMLLGERQLEWDQHLQVGGSSPGGAPPPRNDTALICFIC